MSKNNIPNIIVNGNNIQLNVNNGNNSMTIINETNIENHIMKENKTPKIVVFTGSGISAESGIPTFRNNNGLWDTFKVEDVCTHKAWKENPEFLVEFYNGLRKKMMEAQPNKAHEAITKLQEVFPDLQIITQNVDDLHERANSKNILHLHGELMKLRSNMNPRSTLVDVDGWEQHYGDKHEDGSNLRPHIVFFDEEVVNMPEANKIAKTADIFIVIGTSLQVYPAAFILDYVSWDAKIYVVDPGEVMLPTNSFIEHIKKPASEGVPELVERIIKEYDTTKE